MKLPDWGSGTRVEVEGKIRSLSRAADLEYNVITGKKTLRYWRLIAELRELRLLRDQLK